MSTITSAATAGASAVLPQTQAVSGTPAVSTTGNSTPSVASTAGNGQQTTPSNPPLINQSQHVDASTGAFITQYLDNGNDVVNQVPSNSVIAYLQAGLTADGLPRVGQKV